MKKYYHRELKPMSHLPEPVEAHLWAAVPDSCSEPPSLAPKPVFCQYSLVGCQGNGAQVHSNFIMRAHLYENISPSNIWDTLRLNYYVVYLRFKRQRVWLSSRVFSQEARGGGFHPRTRTKNNKN